MAISLLLILMTQAQEYSWWDHNKLKKVFIVENQFVDFNRSQLPQTIQRPSVRMSGARVFETTTSETQYLLEASPNKLSPAFSNNKNGPITRALPGGVLIRFHKNTHQNNRLKWFSSKKFRVVNKTQTIAGILYLIETPSGIPSLKIANQLYQDPLIEFSAPNWWQNLKLM